MDGVRFDGLIKRAAGGGLPRREALKALAGGALGAALGRTALADAGARKKKKCAKDLSVCPSDAAKCCTKECCLPIEGQGGDSFCKSKGGVCCTAEEGGGACSADSPTCCPVGSRQRFGLCVPQGAACCPIDGGGGWCGVDETCCDDIDGAPSCCIQLITPAGGRRSGAIRPRRRSGARRR